MKRSRFTKDGVKIFIGMKVWILPYFVEDRDNIKYSIKRCMKQCKITSIDLWTAGTREMYTGDNLGVQYYRVFAKRENMIKARKKVIDKHIEENRLKLVSFIEQSKEVNSKLSKIKESLV